MCAIVQRVVYLEITAFLLYSVVTLTLPAVVREAGDELDNWTTTGQQVA